MSLPVGSSVFNLPDGHLLKRSLPAAVAVAVRELHAGGSPMSSSIARKVVQTRQKPAGSGNAELSPREVELLDWLARGRT